MEPGERSDQGMSGYAALSAAGFGEGKRRVALDCRHPQPAEVVQAQAIPAADAGTGERMRDTGPGGNGHQG